MAIRFTKMHGLGNDFMVIEALHQSIHLESDQIQALARRDTGIGFDQCLIVEASHNPQIDFFYRIFNADGQEVGQCGNGARCLARFLERYHLTSKKIITVATLSTVMKLILNKDETVTVDMGSPKLNPQDIPLLASQRHTLYQLPLSKGSCEIHAINVGNPHAILLVDDLVQAPVASLGKQISEHPFFPEQTNVGFMHILNEARIELRVYERGCKETQACGSGAVAAAAIGHLYHQLASEISVRLPGGTLKVSWPDTQGSLYLTGPASFVYEGTLIS